MAAAVSSAKLSPDPVPHTPIPCLAEGTRSERVLVAGQPWSQRCAVPFLSLTLPRSPVESVHGTPHAGTLLNSCLIQDLQPKCTWNT